MLSNLHLISLQYDTALIKFLTLIVLIVILSFLIDFLLSHSFFGKGYRIFVAPGIILHELSHALLCFFTGAQMTRISFFDKTGGSVQHHPSKIPVLGPIAISIAPFIFGATAIYFLSREIGIDGQNLSAVDMSATGVISFFKTALANFDFKDIKTIVIFYLVLSVSVTMTPSFQDLRNMFLSLLTIGAGGFLIIKFTSLSLSALVIPTQIFTLLSTVFLLLILAFVFSIVIFVISKLFNRT